MSKAAGGLAGPGVIRAEDRATVRRWEVPSVDVSASVAPNPEPPPSESESPPVEVQAEELARLRLAAREEGYAEGRTEGWQAGLAEAQEEVEARARYLTDLCQSLEAPLQALDQVVEEQLVHLALTLARQIIRRELHTQPGEIVAVVREALTLLPVASRGVRVRMHPEDAALMRECDALPDVADTWQVEEDPMISRGGCLVVSEDARIDATLERRLAALASQVLGDERVESSPADAGSPAADLEA